MSSIKKALVIGATSGIGKELAKLLVNDGYKVIITGRRDELLKEIKAANPENYDIKRVVEYLFNFINILKRGRTLPRP